MTDAENPQHPDNSPRYHTGKPCIEPGCTEPAGTAWGPDFCQRHNAERIKRGEERLQTIKVLVLGTERPVGNDW